MEQKYTVKRKANHKSSNRNQHMKMKNGIFRKRGREGERWLVKTHTNIFRSFFVWCLVSSETIENEMKIRVNCAQQTQLFFDIITLSWIPSKNNNNNIEHVLSRCECARRIHDSTHSNGSFHPIFTYFRPQHIAKLAADGPLGWWDIEKYENWKLIFANHHFCKLSSERRVQRRSKWMKFEEDINIVTSALSFQFEGANVTQESWIVTFRYTPSRRTLPLRLHAKTKGDQKLKSKHETLKKKLSISTFSLSRNRDRLAHHLSEIRRMQNRRISRKNLLEDWKRQLILCFVSLVPSDWNNGKTKQFSILHPQFYN